MSTVAELDALIDELTVDAYDDEEQLSGFHVGAEEALRPGEPATIVGADVEVVAIDCGPDVRTGLLARVRRGRRRVRRRAGRPHAPHRQRASARRAYRRWQGR